MPTPTFFGQNQVAAAGDGGLNPGSFLAGLDWDMDPDMISGNDNDPVVDWFDVSGADKHYGQNTGTAQPTLKKNAYNGHACVRFATNDFLTQDPNPRTHSATNTLILVCTPGSGTEYILGGNGGEGGVAIITQFGGIDFEYFYTSGGERATFASSAPGLHILTIARTDDTGNYKLYFDGTEVVSNAVNTSNDWNGNAIIDIGNNGNAAGDAFYNGDIAYIIHFNQNHAGTSGLDDLHDAIKARFGIA